MRSRGRASPRSRSTSRITASARTARRRVRCRSSTRRPATSRRSEPVREQRDTCNDDGRCVSAAGDDVPLATFGVISMPVASGAVFLEIEHIANSKDHFHQARVDLGALDRAARAANWTAAFGRPVDPTRIYYAGQSLGGILGATFVGTASRYRPRGAQRARRRTSSRCSMTRRSSARRWTRSSRASTSTRDSSEGRRCHQRREVVHGRRRSAAPRADDRDARAADPDGDARLHHPERRTRRSSRRSRARAATTSASTRSSSSRSSPRTGAAPSTSRIG